MSLDLRPDSNLPATLTARWAQRVGRALLDPLRKHLLPLAAAALLGSAGATASADTFNVAGNTADQAIRQDGTFVWVGQVNARAGRDALGNCPVLVFQLPTLPAGHTVSSANLSTYVETKTNNPAHNVDLYGLGHRSAATVLAGDYFQGAYNGDSTDATAIQDNLITPSTAVGASVSTGSAGDTALASYLNARYAAGGTGQFVFLRLSSDYTGSPNQQYYTVSTANSATASQRPVLTIVTAGGGGSGTARPVARWDFVPDQIISASTRVGVVAFHRAGVRVEFRVNGSLVANVLNPTLNTTTNVWEHWFTLNPSSYADGPITLTARAIPITGSFPSYDLPSLTLYANSGGTIGSTVVKWADSVNGNDANAGTQAAPYKTLLKAFQNTPAGGTINLKAGSYNNHQLNGGDNRIYWTTIQAAPGVNRDLVEVGRPGNNSSRPNTNRLRYKDLTIYTNNNSGATAYILYGETAPDHRIWVDNCKIWNKSGQFAAQTNVFNAYEAYVTSGFSMNLWNGPGGKIIRNHNIENITSDAWTGNDKLVVNCHAINMDRGSTGAHPDFYQSFTSDPNNPNSVILYNVSAVDAAAQGIFGHDVKDSAFVNVLFQKGTGSYQSQITGTWNNVLFFHIDIIDQSWKWRGADLEVPNVSVVNSIFQNMAEYEGGDASAVFFANNHFIDLSNGGATFGTAASTGSAQFVSPASHNYQLQAASPAKDTGQVLQCVPADINGVAYGASPNKGCYAN